MREIWGKRGKFPQKKFDKLVEIFYRVICKSPQL